MSLANDYPEKNWTKSKILNSTFFRKVKVLPEQTATSRDPFSTSSRDSAKQFFCGPAYSLCLRGRWTSARPACSGTDGRMWFCPWHQGRYPWWQIRSAGAGRYWRCASAGPRCWTTSPSPPEWGSAPASRSQPGSAARLKRVKWSNWLVIFLVSFLT